jgi:hypothetical protein
MDKRPPNDRGQGRKPMPENEKTVVGSIRLTPPEWVKFKALGGIDWLRKRIRQASVKEEGS